MESFAVQGFEFRCELMKKRSSVEKAEWSDTREQQYKLEVEELARLDGMEIIKLDKSVYLISNGLEEWFITPCKSKTFWYETWYEYSIKENLKVKK